MRVNQVEKSLLTEQGILGHIYTIRGQRVMLDYDLAVIYGFSTKAFNQQVKRNIDRFDGDFMFQLTREEYQQILKLKKLTLSDVTQNLRSQNVTSSWGGKRYFPYAFTEQGIYMLMTVLKGDLATRQSKTLIRLFKQMKDYLVDNRALVSRQEFAALETKVDGMETNLKKVMDCFDDPVAHKEIVIFDGKKFTADVAYRKIYKLAKKNIYIVDDYIGIKTLEHLQYAKSNIEIKIYSDNKAGRDKLTANLFKDFLAEYGMSGIELKKTNGKVHDRYIFVDYGTKNMMVFTSGASSKDAGNKITTIIKLEAVAEFKSIITALQQNVSLTLK